MRRAEYTFYEHRYRRPKPFFGKGYNTIREIESTFRTLKTDLGLRPIYHKRDDAAMAHLRLREERSPVAETVNVDNQQRETSINCCRKETIRILNPQKAVTTI